jgi:short-subunit dehydrogenase
MNRVLIVGATSAIAEATARVLASGNAHLYLLGRDDERLEAITDDLRVRGAATANWAHLEANDFAAHETAIDLAMNTMGGLDVALIAHGTLGDQRACERDPMLTLAELNTNAISVILLLTHISNRLEAQRHGTIAVIGSVAGDRGRKSNYVYGTAKGAVAIFLQGLRNRLYSAGVHVVTIKPGFVDTPMTRHFKKGLLWASPRAVGSNIARAISQKSNVCYVPWFWRPIMWIIRAIPERIFKRLPL